jgi:hypothetical protein
VEKNKKSGGGETSEPELASSVFIPTAAVVFLLALSQLCVGCNVHQLRNMFIKTLSPGARQGEEEKAKKKHESKMNVCYVKREVN